MELFSTAFWSALISIVIIDLVLAGDNAVVIGMAARNVPKQLQKKVIIWGTAGAIIIRTLATLIVVWLLKIPGLLLIGGILLVWIAYKLLTQKKGAHSVASDNMSMAQALRTIILADAVMGLDNVLAIAGASHGNFILVVIGLAISVPIVIWGSTLIIRLIERYPFIIYIGAGVLLFTAAKMITEEAFMEPYFATPWIKWGFIGLLIAVVLYLGRSKNMKQMRTV